MAEYPPFLNFYLAALFYLLLSPLFGPRLRFLLPLVPLLSLGQLIILSPDASWSWQLASLSMEWLRVDKLSLLFGYLFHLAAFIGFVYALHVKDTLQQVSALLYAGSALGAVFSGDLLSLFLFWEMMAVSSSGLVFARQTQTARGAGIRYLIVQVLSGVLLLSGALVQFQQTGTLRFDAMQADGIAGGLILFAFGIKCAFPLLHNWLVDAYPESTASGTLFLSAFTTKVAVYALARGFAGTELLVYIGAIMTCFPIFYAVIENDLRRVLAYSLINQLGFMVCGVGLGTALALNGAVAHAFADVIFKGLLFMSMGAVLHRVGHTLGSDLGGLHKTMPKSTLLCIIGAGSISAFPLFSGFVTKSMIMSAMIEAGHDWLWLALLFASAGVFHHAGIKIPFFAFFAHDRGLRPKEAPVHMLFAMSMSAFLCLLIGMFPQLLYRLLPWQMNYWPYDLTHTLTQLQLLFFSALAFVWLNKQGIYPPELRSVNLDSDWLYRKYLPNMARWLWSVREFTQPGIARVQSVILRPFSHQSGLTAFDTSQLLLKLLLGLAILIGIGLLSSDLFN
ncbi:Na(+)/H(+) antiporter subunit D [Bowmanella dokdonensis]|uniref:Na(+)/H(+) antiporter subunit D n=1 Tax=Bowmanella dokdonensis TaxID=751969 RepID=A0A939DLU5_9ALTE|nr:Na(+)/H(+) antiporter subunit D [Bowmanella dokdonensis]MBN7825007.1 Na(+)/H(+) antiporter subunit D [Bowmanella dokdonensis]